MDALLTARYRQLFLSYGVGDTGALPLLKSRVLEWRLSHNNRLRWDAALFLVVNFDHMIMRPYFGAITIKDESVDFHPYPENLNQGEWFARSNQALDEIFKYLENNTTGDISSHEILRAVEGTWQKIGTYLFWS